MSEYTTKYLVGAIILTWIMFVAALVGAILLGAFEA